jgi:hypothetical protein
MPFDFPDAPVVDETTTTPDGIIYTWDGVKWTAKIPAPVAPVIGYPDLPAELQQLPVAFAAAGMPAAGGIFNLAMAFALTIPASLAGTVAGGGVASTADAVFTLNKVSGGVPTALGTVTIQPAGILLAGAGGAVAVNDILQLVAPATQDATLADLCITILAMRV